jgi:hypothetical protein
VSGKYVKFREALLQGQINLTSDDIRAILIDAADYTVDLNTHDFLADVPAGARVAASGALGSKTVTNGVFDAADPTLSSVSGDTVEAVLVYKHTGNDATANLLAYVDQATSGLPLTPNGGNVTIVWDNGSFKVFAI